MEAYIDLISRPEGYMDLNAVPEPAGGGVALTDTTPYLYRISADGQNIGSQEFDELVGGTVAWNQLFDDTWSVTLDVANNQRTKAQALPNGSSIRTGHKYLYRITISASENLAHTGSAYLYTRVSGTGKIIDQIGFMADGEYYIILESSYNATSDGVHTNLDGLLWLYIALNASDTSGKATISQVNLIDLTLMFGTTIADYIYSLETAHTGDGVAYFKSLFPNDYYAYDSGTLMSVQTSEHKMVGKNLISINSIQLGGGSPRTLDGFPSTPLPKGTYTFSCVNNSTCTVIFNFYDLVGAGRVNIGSVRLTSSQTEATITLPTEARRTYAYIGETDYNNGKVGNLSNIQMELGSATPYEPYISHSYPLDSSLTLRGIPKLVDNKLTYDGDIYSSDGTVTRKYGIVDLGSLTWQTRATGSVNKVFSATLPSNYMGKLTTPVNWVSEALYIQPVSASYLINNADTVQTGVYSYNGTSASTNVIYCVTLASATPTGHLVYELAEPTTETATPYTNPQIVAKGGTEEYVDNRDVPIPVGHNTKYQGVLL